MSIASFHDALGLYPDHPLGHLGLAVAGQSDFGARSNLAAGLTVMDRAKPIEAALARAQLLAAQGDGQAAANYAARAIKASEWQNAACATR